jgi:MFS family permease
MPVTGALDVETLRRRTIRTLFAGVALGAIGYIAAITVSTIAGEAVGGSAAWAGIPAAAAVFGTASGVTLLAWLSVRSGRRPALVIAYLIGVAGALIAFVGITGGSLALLLIGMLLIGVPNAASQMSRFVGGDLATPERRGSAVGMVVWGSTIGAVLGPNLVGPSGALAEGIGLPDTTGALLVAVVAFVIAAGLAQVLLRPDPATLEVTSPDTARTGPMRSIRTLLGRPIVITALIALIAGQVVMTMVMTMTPLHLKQHGHGLEIVGLVLSAHTLGMFALAPLSGRLTDRFGSLAIIVAGFAMLILASLLAASAPADGGLLLTVALFLLGWGWNLGFVAGSALLAGDLPLGERARLQGSVDASIYTSSAFASLAAGPLLAVAGYATVGLVAAGLAVIPLVIISLRSGTLAPQRAA